METIWMICFCLFVLLGELLRPVNAIEENLFVRISHIPKSITETAIPYFVNRLQCSQRCLQEPSCQGFLISNQIPSCTLLQGFTGDRAPSSNSVQAYISTSYFGTPYIWRTTSISWKDAVTYCQSLGMTMVSYPTSDEKTFWMKALTNYKMSIGVKKTGSDFIDINTNNVVNVNWGPGQPLSGNRNIVLLSNTGFGDAVDDYQLALVTVLCSPTNQ